MLAPTHSIFGIFLTLTILAVFGVQWGLHWSIILCSVLGAIIPDIDHPRSTVGKLFSFISIPLERKYGHRTITHSLIGCLAATAIFSILIIIPSLVIGHWILDIWSLVPRWIAAFGISYFSHLVLDMMNPRGSQMLWPDPVRDVIPKDPKFRPESGSRVEIFVFIFLFICMILAFPISKYGIASSLRWLLATPGSAIEEFKTIKTHTYVEFKGIMSETREPVAGKGEILGVNNKRLVILYKDNVYTLSDELAADITTFHVRVKKTTIPIKVTRYAFNNADRVYLLSRIPKGALISGPVHLPEGLQIIFPPTLDFGLRTFKTVEQKGQDLVLTFASKSQIARLTSTNNYELQNKMDRAELGKLQAQQNKLHSQINDIQSTDDLTPLGKKLLMNKKDHYRQDIQLSELQSQLEEVNVRVEELKSKIADRRFHFSGEVYLRQ